MTARAAEQLGLAPGDVVMSLGTSGTVYAVADATGRYLPLVCTLNATRVTDMIADLLDVDIDELADLALRAEATDPQLVLVPYLEGERTPDLPSATGLITGLRTGTGRADVARAAHLGVLCGLFAGVDALERRGVDLSGRRLLVGGGARSPAFRQLAADLWDRPLIVPAVDEAVAAGACVQAASGLHGTPRWRPYTAWALGDGVKSRSTRRHSIRRPVGCRP